MPFLDPTKMRAVEWASGINWDIRFGQQGGLSEPFTDWFPATDVEENLATLNNHSYEFYLSTYEFPLGSAVFDLQITFIDDVKYTVHEWIADWVNNGILNGGKYLTPLREAARLCEIVRMDAAGEILKATSYWVTPDGSINWTGESSPGPATSSFRFPIAGSVESANIHRRSARQDSEATAARETRERVAAQARSNANANLSRGARFGLPPIST